MPEAIATTPLKTLFKFPFQGPNWRNRFIVGAALTLAAYIVPILPLIFVHGYILGIIRRAIEGQDLALPAWDDWGKLGVDGLRLTLVGLAYLLPGILVFFVGWFLYFVTSFAFPMLAAAAEGGGDAMVGLLVMLGVFGSLAVLMLSMFVGSILVLLGAIPLPVATCHFAAHDKVAAAFRVGEWWPFLRVNKLGYFVAWVVVFGLVAVLYLVITLAYYTCVLCCFIPLLAAPIGFYVSLISAALFGQLYRESTEMLAAREPASAS
jgi:hypothetical protein